MVFRGGTIMQEMVMSTLSKTWIMDLDGTLVKNNGYKTIFITEGSSDGYF